ncbi:RNase P modulator RnpM [Paenibacillus ginsengarvi]|uniref:YlxR family protein n=1 Tax=Paenibacillus ginsengarvi TaxID=400777 RepID=A0A3B0CNI0_9BACL|nr:YlxR family protein [Paenibacillus ginsengarvi]RKN86480.1 YlxR family protein [Paenibacillus ginsengarvi]
MKVRKVPQRKCIVCQKSLSKREMLRIVRTPEGQVELDPSGKKNGRGAYLCGDAEAFKKARKTKAFERALKVNLTPEQYDELERSFAAVQDKYKSVSCGKIDEQAE